MFCSASQAFNLSHAPVCSCLLFCLIEFQYKHFFSKIEFFIYRTLAVLTCLLIEFFFSSSTLARSPALSQSYYFYCTLCPYGSKIVVIKCVHSFHLFKSLIKVKCEDNCAGKRTFVYLTLPSCSLSVACNMIIAMMIAAAAAAAAVGLIETAGKREGKFSLNSVKNILGFPLSSPPFLFENILLVCVLLLFVSHQTAAAD